MYTIANDWLAVPSDIAVLPDLHGYGNVYDLQQAMARDTRMGMWGQIFILDIGYSFEEKARKLSQ